MRKICCFICLAASLNLHAQVDVKLADAMQVFVRDTQMRHAIVGLAVLDAKSGKMVYGYNEQVGLAPASTQKIITSSAAFELLGKDYRYETKLGYDDRNLYIFGSGDPALGSWRYSTTKDSVVLKKWVDEVVKKNIKRISGSVVVVEQPAQAIPDGWIWQDIGNYYGAGAHQLNWHENQYDLVLSSGNNVGDDVTVVNSRINFLNQLKTAAKGTGDNAYIYLPEGPGGKMLLTGTIPAGEKAFTISGAITNPASELASAVTSALRKRNIPAGDVQAPYVQLPKPFYIHYSPPLDSINFWFMRRSINLYGEALLKTMGKGSTDTGTRIVRDFWAANGIDKAAINIIDGSGLSPQNRVTPDALAHILYYAQGRPWFMSFYESLPTFNGMKLKSGSIGGARSFAGYHTSAQGTAYIVSIIVNNYAGASGEIVKKMFRVLDVLK